MLVFVAAAVLAAAPAAAPTQAGLTAAAKACKAPASWLTIHESGRVMMETESGASYGQVMCVLGELQKRGFYQVGLVATQGSPLPTKIRLAD